MARFVDTPTYAPSMRLVPVSPDIVTVAKRIEDAIDVTEPKR